MESHYYNVNLSWTNDRKGKVSSPELEKVIEVATPPEFNGGIEGVWSPEHLLTAAVISCYMTTFLAIAEKSRLEFTTFHCSAKGKLEMIDGRYLMTEMILEPQLTVLDEKEKEKGEKILHKAEEHCLISNSINCKRILKPTITVEHLTVLN